MRLRWLHESKVDLDRIDEHWRATDPRLAARASELIANLALSLDGLPHRGRPSRFDPSTREVVGRFGRGAFIVRYRVLGDEIVIVQVRHSSEAR